MEVLQRYWPDLHRCTDLELEELLQYHITSAHSSSLVRLVMFKPLRDDFCAIELTIGFACFFYRC